MAIYLAVPLKKTFEVDLVKPLRTFIRDTYSTINAEDYEPGLQEFNKLRNSMISKSSDKHESSLEVLYRYCDQLVAVESKFPIAENQIRIDFKWQDCFDKETFFSGVRTMKLASASFEKVCVWFNIASMASQIGESQSPTSDDGLKTAAKLFMQSSGIYGYLKDCVLSHVQGDPTPDLHPDTLSALGSLTLAQAQDCFCRKAMNDKMKPHIISKLAMQCSDLYADVMNLLQLQTLKLLWPKDWIPSTVSKHAAFHGLAEYYQSQVHKEAKEFGEEIVRLQHANKLMEEAERRGGYAFIFQDHAKKIQRALAEAEKDNNFIYHAKVPEQNSMPGLGKHGVAKPTPMVERFSANFTDVFSKVVPLAVHQAMVAFENRKAEIVNMEIGRLREATQLMNGVLSSFNLPAALEDLSGSAVPQSVLDKGAKMRELGGVDYLGQLMRDLPDLLKRNQEILNEAEKALTEEETSDAQLKGQFKERWTRTPSASLTGPIKEEASKYRAILNNAVGADKVVQERFSQHQEGITVLSRSNQDIERFVPSGSPVAALKSTPVVTELKALMEQVETIKAERDVVENEIKNATCDMSSKFTQALAQDGALDEHSLSEAELDRMFTPLRGQVTDSVHKQEGVMANVQRANDQFTAAKAKNQPAGSRDQKLKDLAAAYDMFVELKGNLEEGTKFYNDLTQLLVKFQTKVNDFCFARKTEKEELMKDLSSSIAKQNSAPPPAAPQYQQPQGVSAADQQKSKAAAPAIPPPPTRAPATGQPLKQTAPLPPPSQAPTLPPQGQPVAAYGFPSAATGSPQYNYQGQQQPQPGYSVQPGAYGAGGMPYTPYPVAPGYAGPPMPQGFNPYGQYGYPPQQQPGAPPPPHQAYPQQQQPPPQQQQYPGYPGYPQQQWR